MTSTASTSPASRLASYLGSLGVQAPWDRLSPETVAYAAVLDVVSAVAPEVATSIEAELADQRSHLKLIASENYASPAVLLAMGNWLSDKYAEGAPGHRFYAGCENVDAIESRADELARALFASDHAYIQPHSGIDANLVAFWSILTDRIEGPALERLGRKDLLSLSEEEWAGLRREFGNQRMLGMALDAGGHLTHGFRPNISGKLFDLSHYSVDPQTNRIDYDQVRERALQVRPLVLLAGYSSYPRQINFRIFREIADEVGATFMVDMAHFAGLVAGKVFTGDFDPVRHAHIVTTTTHKTLRGPRGGMVLCEERLGPVVDRGCPLVLGGPLPHVMAAKAVALTEASRPEFAAYARQVVDNAATLADALQSEGTTVVTGGTDNRNVIPFDPNGAWYTSGVRVGTPAATTLGMGQAEMREIASIVHGVLRATEADPSSKARFQLAEPVRDGARKRVADLLAAHPLYPQIRL